MSTETPPLEVRPEIRPTFHGALAGVWLLTWRPRLTWRHSAGLLATILAMPLLASLGWFAHEEQVSQFTHWVIFFYLQLALPLYCLAVLGDLIRGELQTNTLVFLATRPLSRARLFLIKFVCELVWVQCLAATSTGLLLGIALALGVNELASAAAKIFAIQIVAVAAYGALSALLGMLHRRFLIVGAIYGLVVEIGIGQIPTNINNLSINRHLRTLMANASGFQKWHGWSSEGTFTSVLILAAAVVILTGLAALLFTWREYHYNEEMNK